MPKFYYPIAWALAAAVFLVSPGANAQQLAPSGDSIGEMVPLGRTGQNSGVARVVPNTCEVPEYPSYEPRQNLTGATEVRFLVSPSGRVIGIMQTLSSGHATLDAAALAAFRTCKFVPGTTAGKPVEAVSVIRYLWGAPVPRK
jgi:TonB family protein